MEENSVEAMKREEAVATQGAMVGERTAVGAVRELLRFPFEDPEWRNKFLIGSLVVFANFLVPLVPMLALGGYISNMMREAIKGREPSLPEWDDWGELIMEGLKVGAIAIAYLLPGYALLIGGYFFVTFAPFLSTLPLAASGSSSDPFAGVAASAGIAFGTIAVMIVVMGLGFLLLLGGLLPLPLAIGNYIREGQVGAAFRIKEIYSMLRVNKSGFVAAWLLYFGLIYLMYFPMVLMYMTLILICLLPFILPPFMFYIYSLWGVIFGQYYRETRRIWEGKTAV